LDPTGRGWTRPGDIAAGCHTIPCLDEPCDSNEDLKNRNGRSPSTCSPSGYRAIQPNGRLLLRTLGWFAILFAKPSWAVAVAALDKGEGA
jgi:hypothetical protein